MLKKMQEKISNILVYIVFLSALALITSVIMLWTHKYTNINWRFIRDLSIYIIFLYFYIAYAKHLLEKSSI